jgi:hypothetical protein
MAASWRRARRLQGPIVDRSRKRLGPADKAIIQAPSACAKR